MTGVLVRKLKLMNNITNNALQPIANATSEFRRYALKGRILNDS